MDRRVGRFDDGIRTLRVDSRVGRFDDGMAKQSVERGQDGNHRDGGNHRAGAIDEHLLAA